MLKGVFLYEFPELASVNMQSNEAVKAFISSPQDTYREAYGHFEKTYPRQCTFVASSNNIEILKDPTGARRFWTVEVTKVNKTILQKNVDLLWGQAYSLWKANQNKEFLFWLDEEEEIALSKVQDKFSIIDTWCQKIEEWRKQNLATATAGVTAKTLLDEAFSISIDRQTKSYQMRLADALQRSGWTKNRTGEERSYLWFPGKK